MNLLVITTHKSLTLGLNGSQKQPVDIMIIKLLTVKTYKNFYIQQLFARHANMVKLN